MQTLIISIIMMLLVIGSAGAGTLVWDLDDDHNRAEGYILYYTDGEQGFNYQFSPDEATVQDAEVMLEDVKNRLNLLPGIEYELKLSRWNAAGESGKSNAVTVIRKTFQPIEEFIQPEIIRLPLNIHIRISLDEED